MSNISALIERAEALAALKGRALTTISRKLLNDGKGLARLQSGGQCTLRTLEKAFKILEDLEREARTPKAPPQKNKARAGPPMMLTHLHRLEAESIHIMREVAASSLNPVMLYSAGKDSAVMLHLALKAFYPSKPPFPLLHIDTGWKFKQMIAFRDKQAGELGLKLHVHKNPDGAAQGIGPFTHGSEVHTDVMKTQGLKQALDKYGFDAAFGGARRDEEKSRAKERVFSHRAKGHSWDPRRQRPELWNIYNTRIAKGENLRVFPLSNWTELDVWQYIDHEKIDLPDLYFAARRKVVKRDGLLIMMDDERMVLKPGEQVHEKMVRFRTLGCYPLTGAIESSAASVSEIISEMRDSPVSERAGRAIDQDSHASMEAKKAEGYF